VGSVDLTHAAGADVFQDAKVPQGMTYHGTCS
jgi:hypothetical protein